MKEYSFESDRKKIPEAIDFIRSSLQKKGSKRNHIVRTLLAAEEILEKICEVADEGSLITISMRFFLNDVKIRYSAKGGEFTVADIKQNLLFLEDSVPDEKANEAMEGLIARLFDGSLNVRCDKGKISVTQIVVKSPYRNLVVTVVALVAGILAGLILHSAVPVEIADFLINNIFTPVYTVLMNALKMIVAPLVFFSIAGSIADFSDIKSLGRIAGKVVGMYLFTSMIAIGVGYFTYSLFPIGNPGLAQAVDADAALSTIQKGASAAISIKDTLVGIVPTNIITPFQNSDMLQIIFIAVCLGLATAALSKAAPMAKDFVKTMNMVFSKITEGIVSFIPLLVFCSMAKMMASMNLKSFVGVITWIPVVCLGDVIMIIIYMVLLLLVARLNPIKFIGKYYPAMISAFTLSSSNATLPSSIRQCSKLGISEKIYSFSLPLGATINMDGNCITLMISALFFVNVYQLPINGTMLLQLFVAIMVLSVGAPGVPGGNLVCLTLLIPQIGVPAEAISLLIGLYPLISMMQTMANVTGDAVVTTIAAKSEKMVDIDEFNR